MSIKLRELNKRKMCPICKEIVEIVMEDLVGFCSQCLEKDIKTRLYTIDTRQEKNK